VEDYFHVSAFEGVIAPESWDDLPPRVEDNTMRVLEMLDSHGLTATFFVLGWVAKRFPDLVRAIQAAGHEIACHGYGHERICFQSPSTFRRDVSRAKALLEDITGQPVLGYRAPSYSITQKTLWALDILMEEGFLYDSSIFPIAHDLYGIPGAYPHPHRILRDAGEILEFPPTTLRLSLWGRGLAVPIAGGGYLRLFPEWFLHWGLEQVNTRDGQPIALYFHPWEIDPDQPRVKAGWKSSFRHYHNLEKTEGRLRRLFGRMNFAPMGMVLEDLGNLQAVRMEDPSPAAPSRTGNL
jgi:polysaccharide deacetylase family protein (PEP-CTERM system associated)